MKLIINTIIILQNEQKKRKNVNYNNLRLSKVVIAYPKNNENTTELDMYIKK